MAYITITTTEKSIIVDFGVYSNLSDVDGKKGSYKRGDISIISLEEDETYIIVRMKDVITRNDWPLSFDGYTGTFKVDTIDGIAPTSNGDLFNKIDAIR
jgi:hypothetical protein